MSTVSPLHSKDVQSFFDALSKDYDAIIDKTFPPHREAFGALTDYLFFERNAEVRILELGCGTGNLSLYLSAYYPYAQLTLLDLSPEMLKKVAEKMTDRSNTVRYVEAGFMDAEFEPDSFDLVVASIALHHLTDNEKGDIYKRIHGWLAPGGQFRCADGVLTLPKEQAHPVVQGQWGHWAKQLGAQDEEIAMWREHEVQFDHFTSLHEHFAMLDAAGFRNVDCYWKKFLWAVFGGGKA